MKDSKVERQETGRRDFLKLTATGAAAAGGTMLVGKAASAAVVEDPKGAGYRLTSHVKTYYDLARF